MLPAIAAGIGPGERHGVAPGIQCKSPDEMKCSPGSSDELGEKTDTDQHGDPASDTDQGS
jgi:hypothetical protein